MIYALVAVGYNRVAEMQRLLKSICNAKLGNIQTDLVISLDYSDKQEELKKISEQVDWNHGSRIVRAFSERQGLKKHILQCGDLTEKYDAVIVLEDDLVVAEGFMQYVSAAVEAYEDNDEIAGISLYTHQTNPGNGRFFEAQFNGYDAFLMQYAQSWGQCWTRKMWRGFKKWYELQGEELTADEKFPDYVASWNKQSWLKYYTKYTVEEGKYHVYPYHSLTTNGSGIGEHNDMVNTSYQVSLQFGVCDNYRFPSVEQAVKYDAFFERIFDTDPWEGEYGSVLYDIYGLRHHYGDSDTIISIRDLPYEIIRKIGLKYRPHEQNMLIPEDGEGIYVYNLHKPSPLHKVNEKRNVSSYEFRAQSGKLVISHGAEKIKQALARKLTRR